jgi:hypothetical protein
MSEGIKDIEQKIAAFKRKHYQNLFLKGTILTLTIVFAYFALASLLEYNLWLGKSARFVIFVSFFCLVGFCVFQFLKAPLAWWVYKRGLGEEESAKLIGNHFPVVGDRLLNLIQLASQSSGALAEAGIFQKANSFKDISFEAAITFKENIRYLKYFSAIVVVIFSLALIDQQIFTQSTQRIVQFNQEFSPKAPFLFNIKNQELSAFFNEDFSLQLSLEGAAIPETVYLVLGAQRFHIYSKRFRAK